jgi:hypothetical protein
VSQDVCYLDKIGLGVARVHPDTGISPSSTGPTTTTTKHRTSKVLKHGGFQFLVLQKGCKFTESIACYELVWVGKWWSHHKRTQLIDEMTALASVVVGALSITMSAGSSAGKPNFLTVLADGECV